MRRAAVHQQGLFPAGDAVFDALDNRYRYMLTRTWSGARPATFVMLNPSTADENRNDPTVRRCIGYAQDWGCGGLIVANLFAWRSTDPDELLGVPDPAGRDNDRHILGAALAGSPVICAWGSHKAVRFYGRDRAVLALLRGAGIEPLCLRQTDGRPWHPLYLPAALKPEPLKESET